MIIYFCFDTEPENGPDDDSPFLSASASDADV